MKDTESQADKFRTAARDHDTDDAEEVFDAHLKRIAKASSREKAADPKADRQPD